MNDAASLHHGAQLALDTTLVAPRPHRTRHDAAPIPGYWASKLQSFVSEICPNDLFCFIRLPLKCPEMSENRQKLRENCDFCMLEATLCGNPGFEGQKLSFLRFLHDRTCPDETFCLIRLSRKRPKVMKCFGCHLI